ncbi:MAG TPA: alpha/beta hydrolase [Solirubrobacterales bacterium]|nr:alpha/beta hydrolase [Solirubrobacterales bacterium]
MPRWLKITLGVIAGLIVLLVLNAFVVSNATRDAYVRDAGARLVETSNGTLQVLEQGNQSIRPPQTPRPGTPIVLVHCYTCSMKWWDDLAPLLERDHRVIRVDLLGHGGSDKPGGGYSIADQATAVAEALARLGVVNATVVGHSLGGSVVTALAQRSPQLATRVVIIDQAPEDGFDNEGFAQRISYWPVIGQASERLLHIAPKSEIRDQYDDAFAPGYDIATGFANPDQPVDDLRAMTYTAYKDTHDAEEEFVAVAPLDERLATAHLPTMVIFGAEDQLYDAQAAIDRYRQNVPGVQTHLIPGAGHSPNVERPNAVAPLILSWAAPPRGPLRPARKPATKKQQRKQASR